jgi:UDP-GlcNAc:undecaprenyl-phosphate GlcNAc-1-phosphate transferase
MTFDMQIDPASLIDPRIALLAVVSYLGCLVLLWLARIFPRLAGRVDDANAVQATHIGLTPRIGGVAIFGALALSVPFAPPEMLQNYTEIIFATTILFLVGLREDLGYPVSPRNRLLTVVGVSLLVIVLIGEWLPRMGLPYVDTALQYWMFGIPFTLLITAGVANGFNLIDGVNGLASLTAVTSGMAIAAIAYQSDYISVAVLGLMMAAAVFGFFVVNFPFGLIFLGDAGAYTVGFVLSWFGIAILTNIPDASPWAILLVLFWPLADTLLAMFRRRGSTRGAMLPDRLHFHQLVMRTLEICWVGRERRDLSNPFTTVILAPFVIAPQVAGVMLWDANFNAFLAVLVFLTLFFASYRFLLGYARRNRRRISIQNSPDT